MTDEELFAHCVERHALFVGTDIVPDEAFHVTLRKMHDMMHARVPAKTHYHTEDGTTVPVIRQDRRDA